MARWSDPMLRVSLGIVFVWFGALKILDVRSELTDRGVNPAAIDIQINVSDDPKRELVTVARNYDLTVRGRTREPDLRDQVFGPVSSHIINRADSAVLTIK